MCVPGFSSGPACAACVLTTCLCADGKLINNLLGPKAGDAFVKSWGIGIGLGQANEAQDLVLSLLQMVLAVTVLEVFWVMTNMRWLGARCAAAFFPALCVADAHGQCHLRRNDRNEYRLPQCACFGAQPCGTWRLQLVLGAGASVQRLQQVRGGGQAA